MEAYERLAKAREVTVQKRAALDAALEGFGPPCTTCRHHIAHKKACGHIAYSEATANPLTETLSVKWANTTIDTARSREGLCGPEALLWEEKRRKSFWAKLAGR